MRILFLSRWYPYPADNGSKLRIHGLLRGLCDRHDVTLVSFCNSSEPKGEPSSPAPSAIHALPYREFAPASGRALLGFASATPRYLIDTHSREMETLIRDVVGANRFDLVIASQLPMAAYAASFRGIPAIFEEAELGIYWPGAPASGSALARMRQRMTWAKHTRFMARLLDRFVMCTVASDVERQLLAEAVPAYRSVHVVPNSVSGDAAVAGDRIPGSLIFTGSLQYRPNQDAMTWFLDEIFPIVRARVAGASLTITGEVGSNAPQTGPDVRLTGRVPDVRALVARAAVSVAPLRAGGGTRLKILEAMALGTPVVATSKAAEGLDTRDGEHLLIADTAPQFAQAIERLLADPAGARGIADRAKALFHSRYDTRVVVPEFLRLVEHAAAA